MAGRGTDILLGGNPDFLLMERLKKKGKPLETIPPEELEQELTTIKAEIEKERQEVIALGGLHIVGTERHESRRIDNQLRGRAGRQGDPGSSRFFLSLQDDLLRIFGGDRMQRLMLRLGMEEDVPIESRMISKRIQSAQETVEAQNFASRKHVLEYDDVMNKQRQAVYGMRHQLLEGVNQKERILEMVRGIVQSFLDQFCPENKHIDEYNLLGLQNAIVNQFGMKVETADVEGRLTSELEQQLYDTLVARYEEKERMVGPENMREAERIIMLNVIDNQWKDHLLSMDHLKEGIGLRGYGQKDPLIEYKREGFEMFQDMMERIEDETIRYLFFLRIETSGTDIPMPYPEPEDDEEDESEEEAELAAVAAQREAERSVLDLTRNIQRKKEKELAALQLAGGGEASTATQTVSNPYKNVGRNDPCPCGSGKKFKKCHGA
jgi:preprotein translocase subunit SecA